MDNYAKDFEEFWREYPRRVGKLAAYKAYRKARTTGVTQAELLAGIATYIKGKPQYADFCHASTWLNAGRWMDEYEPVRTGPRIATGEEWHCRHVPPCHSRFWCEKVRPFKDAAQ